MKISTQKKDLVGLLGKTQNIVEKRNTMPVLVNVLIEAKEGILRVFATDLEVSLTDEISANVSEEGRLAVNAKNFFDIIKELNDDEILLKKKPNNWLEIKQGKSVFNIIGISPEEYPVFPTYTTDAFIKLESKLFLDMIEKTIYSVSNDETRYHLNGVYFERSNEKSDGQFRMVATDGHRLSLVDHFEDKGQTGDDVQGVIIPRKGLNEVRKILDASNSEFEMAVEGAQLIVKSDKTILMVRLIEGKYPNYKQLIPKNLNKTVMVKKDQFSSCLKRVSLLSNQKSKGITLSLSEGKLEISSNNPELGDAREEIEVDYSGNEMKIGFNAKYIIDILNSCNDDEIDINLNDQLSPGMLQPHGNQSYTCVVMPMRI